jgi:hypothetical protein
MSYVACCRSLLTSFLLAGLGLQLLSGCQQQRPLMPMGPRVTDSARLSALEQQLRPYRQIAERIIGAAIKTPGAFHKLQRLCDEIGHRLAGSPALDRAIAWALNTMKGEGHERVRAEPVMVPSWVRGEESLLMLTPRIERIPLLGLGGSVGTPHPIEAEVVAVENEAALRRLGTTVSGKIVLFNNPMAPYDRARHLSDYGTAVRFRIHGARWAADLGARAVLIRSVSSRSLRTPHTGAMHYGKAQRRIPAAAIAAEDADQLMRLARTGRPVRLRLHLGARHAGLVPSANVIAELRGSSRPEEIVLIGGHLDSWDVGQGAHDDGAGCVMAMEALTLLRRLGLRPKRTIRVVLWTNEELGLSGARAYARAHATALPKHVAAIESDSGAFRPIGFGVEQRDKGREQRLVASLRTLLAQLFTALDATSVFPGHAGADLLPLLKTDIVLLGLRVEGSAYFDYHHSAADTLDKVDPADLNRGVAAMALMAYVLADLDPPLRP